ncbi:MAG TPA: hypothetical protein VL068_08015 [Microthrixaceae bacterium]|nr:hypothetical protein [Microthrixaceae bacterium]
MRIDWPDFSRWFRDAFEAVRPALVRTASDRALFDHLSRSENHLALRDAIMLGAALGYDDQLSVLIQRADDLTDRWRAQHPVLSFHDRMKNPIMWSHKRFMRQMDRVIAERPQ